MSISLLQYYTVLASVSIYSRTSLSRPPVRLGLKWSHSGVVLLVRVTGMGLTLSEV